MSCELIWLAIYPEKALEPVLLGSSTGQKLAATIRVRLLKSHYLLQLSLLDLADDVNRDIASTVHFCSFKNFSLSHHPKSTLLINESVWWNIRPSSCDAGGSGSLEVRYFV